MNMYRRPQQLKAIIFDIDSTLYSHKEYALQQNQIQIHHYAQLEEISDQEARQRIEDTQRNWEEKSGGKALSLGNTFVQLGYSIEESIRWREELLEPADFLVKESSSISSGLHFPVCSRYFTFPIIVVVFPLPAPAMTRAL